MKILSEAKVYLIYHSEVQSGLRDYLQESQKFWRTTHQEDETAGSLEPGEDQERFPEWAVAYPGDSAPEFSGRTCYDSFRGPGAIGSPGRKSNEEYLEHIKITGHGSVMEHPVATFIFCGCSRGLTHELVRHRAGWAYSQSSTRYCDGELLNVVMPPLLDQMLTLAETDADRERVHEATAEFAGAYKEGRFIYTKCFKTLYGLAEKILAPHYGEKGDKTLLRKMVRSAARSLLPIGTEAPIVVSANYRAWRHFFTMRATEAAELEIRAVALQVFDKLILRAPNLLKDFTKYQLRDGTYALKTDYVKV